MRGRKPKQTAPKRRPEDGWTLVLETDRVENPPKLPRLIDNRWLKETRRWWEAVWSSPFATLYEETDVRSLVRLARLQNKFWREPSATLSKEIRYLETELGLTPRARARLKWAIVKPEPNGDKGRRLLRDHSRPSGPQDDLRDVLSQN